MTDEKYINLKEKRDIGHVINASFSFLRISYFKMFPYLLIFAVPLYVIGSVISSGVTYMNISTVHPSFYLFSQPEYYLSFVFYLLGQIMVFCIVANYILQYTQTGSANFDSGSILKAVKVDFFKMVLADILFWLITILGLILLVIPGIYYYISNFITFPLLVLEKKGINHSFSESRRLVKNNWWRTCGLFYLSYFLTALLTIPFFIPNLIVTFIVSLHLRTGNLEDYHISSLISMIITSVGSCLLYPVFVTALTVYTFSLKETKDHVSLSESIENIGTQPIQPKEDEGSY